MIMRKLPHDLLPWKMASLYFEQILLDMFLIASVVDFYFNFQMHRFKEMKGIGRRVYVGRQSKTEKSTQVCHAILGSRDEQQLRMK